ncbi:MAG TPA: hypothetical protein VJT72_10850 [Pseudonocardiaceae bacterium]|nr:hypothetical protein [Pseudonocardiaceae bacterium]
MPNKVERRRMLVLAVIIGDDDGKLVEKMTGRTGRYWAFVHGWNNTTGHAAASAARSFNGIEIGLIEQRKYYPRLAGYYVAVQPAPRWLPPDTPSTSWPRSWDASTRSASNPRH